MKHQVTYWATSRRRQRMDQRNHGRRLGPGEHQMVQHRWRPDNNRRGPRQPVHDHHGGGGAHWRAGEPISTEWTIHRFADRHPHQPDADPCGTPAFPKRAGPKPDRAAATAGHAPGGDKASHLHPGVYADVYADPYPLSGADPRAELSGSDPRAELGGTAHEPGRAGHACAHIVGALKGIDAGCAPSVAMRLKEIRLTGDAMSRRKPVAGRVARPFDQRRRVRKVHG
jgi:hypothetical protein